MGFRTCHFKAGLVSLDPHDEDPFTFLLSTTACATFHHHLEGAKIASLSPSKHLPSLSPTARQPLGPSACQGAPQMPMGKPALHTKLDRCWHSSYHLDGQCCTGTPASSVDCAPSLTSLPSSSLRGVTGCCAPNAFSPLSVRQGLL
jgi:hypothetical protein